jgi:hypothetical protein
LLQFRGEALCGTLFLILTALQETRGGKIEWGRDFEDALREAKRGEQPLMVYLTDDK